uniref:Uncharacterized protein n=1 Tax=Junco hyemalis TaxID=40217 RepID=A0A8C5JQX7_JUNHY
TSSSTHPTQQELAQGTSPEKLTLLNTGLWWQVGIGRAWFVLCAGHAVNPRSAGACCPHVTQDGGGEDSAWLNR